ncbi:MAG: molybdopterin-dependent oxidoreductase [Coriobacteriales bacterium]|jgi:anaerobic dimethyl sulfoxide reductase subunit A|nr:molybdopterin-dependent oxidoreductase [Coriobacteriales bacterium]
MSNTTDTTEQAIHREGDEIRYTICQQNGCFTGCLLACHVSDGKLVAIDVGDPIHADMPREDVGETAVREGMIQHRPCVRGRMWRKTLYHPNRALHPMKNIGQKGSPVWEQISWEEALDTIAQKIVETRDTYGPYSISGGMFFLDFAAWAGFGHSTWGCASTAGHTLADAVVMGVDLPMPFGHSPTPPRGTEPPDLLNAKLIIAIGWNPAVSYTADNLVLALARERGIPIIVIDSRYTSSVQAYADQWIPIRPGTDIALLLALAHVLFTEDLLDHAFVDRFVEPEGFARWRSYVLGEADGIAKTPEWAETICAVPAETIRELARLYGAHHGYSDGNACFFKLHFAPARIVGGENVGRAGIYLQALTGNIGVPGGYYGGGECTVPFFMPVPMVNWQRAMPSSADPMSVPLYDARGWVDAVLLKDRLDSGEMTEEEYRHRIGCAEDWPLPDIHMAFNQVGTDIGTHDNQRMWEAYRKLDFVVKAVYHADRPEAAYADIVLPLADPFFEASGDAMGGGGFFYPGFMSVSAYGNYFILSQKVIEPPGEAKPLAWINAQIARRLGILDEYNPRLADVLDDPKAWDERYVELQREAYEEWRVYYAGWAEESGIEPAQAPSFDEFWACPIFRVPLKREPHYGFKEQIQEGMPFNTESGRIEFHSHFLADPDMADKEFIFPQTGAPSGICFGGSKPAVIPPQAEYTEAWDSPLGQMAQEYPLRLITPHSFFRQNTAQDNNLWIEDEARHALWISVADARERGIRDGDMVRIANPQGEGILPAYVTSRVGPGTICMVYGAWYRPGLSQEQTERMPDGVDLRGSANNFTSSRMYPWVKGNLHCASLAQVEKVNGGEY